MNGATAGRDAFGAMAVVMMSACVFAALAGDYTAVVWLSLASAACLVVSAVFEVGVLTE